MNIIRIASFLAALTPAAVWAHPGHFDGAPIAHNVAHSLPYVLIGAAALVIAKTSVRHAARLVAAHKRRRC